MTTTPVMTITDEQIAEIEEAIPCGKTMGHGYGCDKSQACRECSLTLALIYRLRAAEKDAERYRVLREFHWSNSEYAVVRNPKEQVKLGAQCPFGLLLDEAIDAAMEQSK